MSDKTIPVLRYCEGVAEAAAACIVADLVLAYFMKRYDDLVGAVTAENGLHVETH